MRSSIKSVMLTISITAIMMAFVLGQVAPVLAQSVPATSNLVKRDFTSTDNQHLTASSGNTIVCGDHLCAPGEWAKLQDDLNRSQLSHSVNSTNTMSTNSVMSVSTNATMKMSSNSTSIPSPNPVQSSPAPISTPPTTPSSVCTAVMTALGNSTVSSSVSAKVMSDLGCSS
ncbi:MAG: hypothetical protein ACREA5_00395 [Nitrosotalea sp.]